MDFNLEIKKLEGTGLSTTHAENILFQDVILQAISKGPLSRNITIKGGVVMRNISNSKRRVTMDLDIDFLRISIDDDSIKHFLKELNVIDGISISLAGEIEELRHQDYKGKRIYARITDEKGYSIRSKIDIGVHNRLSIEQTEYCFDICYDENGASLLMNTPEQMIAEKLKSLLRFQSNSTRYKDIFDIYFLCEFVKKEPFAKCIIEYVYKDATINVNDREQIIERLELMLEDKEFLSRIEKSQKNWLEIDTEEVFRCNVDRIKELLE